MFDWGSSTPPLLFLFVNRLPGNVVIIVTEASICSFGDEGWGAALVSNPFSQVLMGDCRVEGRMSLGKAPCFIYPGVSAHSAARSSLVVPANDLNPAGLNRRLIHFALWLPTKCTALQLCTLRWVYHSGIWSECHKIHKQPFVTALVCHQRGQGAKHWGAGPANFRLQPDCLWEAILHACNYTSLIDNAEKLHWFGVSWRSAAAWPLITFQFCNVRFVFCRLRRGCSWSDHTWAVCSAVRGV